uniref:Uncharacterized protein n=1 Tax=Photinus pyralis TaxID=7054 RepID=A0A1Y1LVH5_PHOPY
MGSMGRNFTSTPPPTPDLNLLIKRGGEDGTDQVQCKGEQTSSSWGDSVTAFMLCEVGIIEESFPLATFKYLGRLFSRSRCVGNRKFIRQGESILWSWRRDI